ncbi:MAG TPA: hypothetical protein VIV15_15215 [Anaerolineales bacterium]
MGDVHLHLYTRELKDGRVRYEGRLGRGGPIVTNIMGSSEKAWRFGSACCSMGPSQQSGYF